MRDRYGNHFLSALTVAEGRAWAGDWCRELARRNPAWTDELLAAAQCYRDEHDLMWAVWEFTGGNAFGDENVRKFKEGGVRRRIVPLIRLARKLDEEAAGHLERTLAV